MVTKSAGKYLRGGAFVTPPCYVNLLAQPVPDGPLVLGLIGAGLADNKNAIVFGNVMFVGA